MKTRIHYKLSALICAGVGTLMLGACGDVSDVTSTTESRVTSEDTLFVPIAPSRVLDTRILNGVWNPRGGGAMTTQSLKTLCVVGQNLPVPTGASGVVLNVTADADPANTGDWGTDTFVTVYPAGGARPLASNLNVRAGQIIPNMVVVPLGENGCVDIYNHNGRVHLVADVTGYLDSPFSIHGSRLIPTFPTRFDGHIPSGGTVAAPIRTSPKAAAFPGAITGGVFTFTARNTPNSGFLTAYPANEGMPLASTLNYDGTTSAQGISNSAFLKTGGDAINIYSKYDSDVQTDITGFFTKSPPTANEGFVRPIAPTRVLDTREGGQHGAFGPGETRLVQVLGAGSPGVPNMVSHGRPGAAIINLTAAEGSGAGTLTAGGAGPSASSLSYRAGQNIPSMALVRLNEDGTTAIHNEGGPTHVVVDVLAVVSGEYADNWDALESDTSHTSGVMRLRCGIVTCTLYLGPKAVTGLRIAAGVASAVGGYMATEAEGGLLRESLLLAAGKSANAFPVASIATMLSGMIATWWLRDASCVQLKITRSIPPIPVWVSKNPNKCP